MANIFNADKSSEWSYHPQEQEVNLQPFFTFQVADITETESKDVLLDDDSKVRAKIIEITVVEVPFQNFLKPREIMQ